MKVEITKKAPEPKPETPFVVGGVYRFKDTDRFYVLSQTHDDKFMWVAVDSGYACTNSTYSRGGIISAWFDNGIMRLCGNARLVIEE